MSLKKEKSGRGRLKFLLRRVYHATETEERKAERFITNTLYKSDSGSYSLKLLPVPDCIENICSMPNCDKPAICMIDYGNDNYRTICESHLRDQFPERKLVQERALMTPSVEQAIKANAFEWQPQGKNDNWYKIRGVNIIGDCQHPLPKKVIKDRFYVLMSEVLEDNPQLVDGEYIKEEKKLIIWI